MKYNGKKIFRPIKKIMFSSFTLETHMLLKLVGFQGNTPNFVILDKKYKSVTICNVALAPIEVFVPATKLAEVLYE